MNGEIYRTSGEKLEGMPGQARVGDREYVGDGTEVTVYRAPMVYGEKEVRGMVFKRLNSSANQSTYEGSFLRTLQAWNRVLEINRESTSKGGPTFNVPRSIRGYWGEKEAGFWVTDLTEGGEKGLVDAKQMGRSMPDGYLSEEAWSKIKERILQDLKLAEDNGLILSATYDGGHALDPWSIVYDPGSGEVEVFVTDIGFFTQGEHEEGFRRVPADDRAYGFEVVRERVEHELEYTEKKLRRRGKFIDQEH